MSYIFKMLFLFWFVVMSLLSSWDEMDVRVELLADDVWSAEDDITGSLSVEVNSFDQLYLKEQPISSPMVQISTIKQKYEKWGKLRKLNKSKYEIFWWIIKIYCVCYPPYGKIRKIKKCQ